MSGERVAVRAYRALTRLYPRRFRNEYGADMVSLFRDQWRDEPAWRLLPRSAVDLAITIPIQHLEARMHRDPSRLVPLTYLAVAAAGLLLVIVGGTRVVTAIIGLGIALVAGTVGAMAWRRTTPVHESTLTANWWKYLIAGPCLVALVIIAAGAGVDAWFLGMACVFTALVLTAIGLILGLSHLFHRHVRGIPT
jgi:hypothetical protein